MDTMYTLCTVFSDLHADIVIVCDLRNSIKFKYKKYLNDMCSLYHDPSPLHPGHVAPMAKGKLCSFYSLMDRSSTTWLQMTQDSPYKVRHLMGGKGRLLIKQGYTNLSPGSKFVILRLHEGS